MLYLFALFIVACGVGHLVALATLWQPAYGLQGLVKAFTAAVSAVTAVLVWPLIPRALALPSPAALREANTRLEAEVVERGRAERQFEALRREAEAARAKSEFLGTMSHEIRTPLTAVLGMADLLAEERLGERADRYVEAIRRSGRQLLAVVNDILDFQRLGAGRLPLHEVDFLLDDVLEEVRSTLQPMAHESGVALEVAPPPTDLALRGDAVRLR